MVKIVLPYPPSSNRYWRNYRGVVCKSEHAKAYQQEVWWLVKAEGVQPLEGDVSVSIDVYRPARRGDLDNCLKVLLDSLNGVAYHDDKQITELFARRFDDKQNPRVEITISLCTARENLCTI